MKAKEKICNLLHWSEKYTQTDMVYLAKGSLWWTLGRICVSLVSMAIMVAFAHWVSKEVYGAYQYILSTIAILSIFALPGMDTALVRTVARGYEKTIFLCAKNKIKWAQIGAGICLAISLWYLFHQNFNLGISFLIASIFLPFFTTFNLFLPFWQGKKRFDLQSKYLILLNVLAALILLPIIFLTDNLILIILTYFTSQTLLRAIFFRLTLKKITNQEEEKESISFGKHLTLMGSIGILGKQIDKIIIWQLLGPVSVAIYSFAQLPVLKIRELIPVSPLALPILSQKNIKEIKKKLFLKFSKLFLISIPCALFFITLAPYFYKIFFPAYIESILYFRILSLSLIFFPFALLNSSLIAGMKTKELYIIRFIPPILKIILFLALIPLYGLLGIIAAILITHIFSGILILYFFKKI